MWGFEGQGDSGSRLIVLVAGVTKMQWLIGVISLLTRGYIRVVLRLYWGYIGIMEQENGSYYLGFRVYTVCGPHISPFPLIILGLYRE